MGRPKKAQPVQSPSDPNRAQSFLAKAREAIALAKDSTKRKVSDANLHHDPDLALPANAKAKSSGSVPAGKRPPPCPAKATPSESAHPKPAAAAPESAHPKPAAAAPAAPKPVPVLAKHSPQVPPVRCNGKTSEEELARHCPKALSIAPPPPRAASELNDSPAVSATPSSGGATAFDRTRMCLEKAKQIRLAAAGMTSNASTAEPVITDKVSANNSKETTTSTVSLSIPEASEKNSTQTVVHANAKHDQACFETVQPSQQTTPSTDGKSSPTVPPTDLCTPPPKQPAHWASATPSPVSRMQSLSSWCSEDSGEWAFNGCSQRSYYGSKGQSWWAPGWDYYPPNQSWFWDEGHDRYVGAWGSQSWTWKKHNTWAENDWEDWQPKESDEHTGPDNAEEDEVGHDAIRQALVARRPSSLSELAQIASPHGDCEPAMSGCTKRNEPGDVKQADMITEQLEQVLHEIVASDGNEGALRKPDTPQHVAQEQHVETEDPAQPGGEAVETPDERGSGPHGWRCDKHGQPCSPKALYMRFYRSIRSSSPAYIRQQEATDPKVQFLEVAFYGPKSF